MEKLLIDSVINEPNSKLTSCYLLKHKHSLLLIIHKFYVIVVRNSQMTRVN